MGQILSYLLFGFAVVSAYISVQEMYRKTSQRKAKYLFIAYQLSSVIWSLFFGLLLAQTNTETAATMRSLGMIGMFGYLIFATLLMSYWAKLKGVFKVFVEGFTYTAVVLYPFTISRENITFQMSRFGMSYEFTPGFWSYAYTGYTVILAANMFFLIFFMMKKSRKKREKVMGRMLLICETVIIIGMVLDTILPQFGIAAFPGSSTSQFLGAMMLYYIYLLYCRSQITLDNMSRFVYYSVNEPILIYDEQEELKIVSSSAAEFFGEAVQENSKKSWHRFLTYRKIF